MYPKSARILKYKAYLRRKFVREQKEKLEDTSNHLKLKDDLEVKKSKLLDNITRQKNIEHNTTPKNMNNKELVDEDDSMSDSENKGSRAMLNNADQEEIEQLK